MAASPRAGRLRRLALLGALASALVSALLLPLLQVEQLTQAPRYRRLLPAAHWPLPAVPPAFPPLPSWVQELVGLRDANVEQHRRVPAPRPPVLTRLANFSYSRPPAATAEQLRSFQQDGFVVLRGAIDAEVLDELRAWAAEYCAESFRSAVACQVEQARWVSDVLRDFVLFGPLGRLVSPFMLGRGVRVLQEGFFAHRYAPFWVDPEFFSYGPHVDTSQQVGLSGGMRSDTVGLHVWMPLHDIDPASDGGSVHVFAGFPRGSCVFFAGYQPTQDQNVSAAATQRDCEKVWWHQRTLSLRKGDIALWHQNMLHATQPVLNRRHTRYAWYARLSEADGVLCNYVCTTSLPYIWGGGGPMPCCRHGLRSGDRVRGPCFPRIHPSPLEDEVGAHLVQVPSPLVHKYEGAPESTTSSYWGPGDMDASCRGTLRWVD